MYKIFFLVIINLCFIIKTFAYESVYRMDFRPPIEQNKGIFTYGFYPRGNNFNLMDHLTGASCSSLSGVIHTETPSVYISTSKFLNATISYAYGFDKMLSPNSQKTIWLYTIRADSKFYDVGDIIVNYIEDLSTIYGEARMKNIVDDLNNEQEVVTMTNIPITQIVSATPYIIEKDETGKMSIKLDEDTPMVMNPYFININTQINPTIPAFNILFPLDNVVQNRLKEWITGFGLETQPQTTACWCAQNSSSTDLAGFNIDSNIDCPSTRVSPIINALTNINNLMVISQNN